MDHYLWIIGCGDIGKRLAKLYMASSDITGLQSYQQAPIKINALVSSTESLASCETIGLTTTLIDIDNSSLSANVAALHGIDGADLFYFVPPQPEGEEDRRIQSFCNTIVGKPKRIVLISTTGVYGDSKGAWIDENTPLNPQADRAKRRLSAEQFLQTWAAEHHVEYIILRVPGVYANDRLPLARLKKGLPVVNVDEAGWTNRIHADDLAMVCKVAMESDISGEIYNATDGSPSTMTEYFNKVADSAGLPRPPQISMQEAEKTLSKGMVSYLRESRRISNKKMLRELAVKLRYPSLKEGLQD